MADDTIGMPPCSGSGFMRQRGLHEEAIEDYDELMRLDTEARCAAVLLRSEKVGLDRLNEGLSK